MKKTILILGIIFLLVVISIIPISYSISNKVTNSNDTIINIQSLQIQCKSIDKNKLCKPLAPISFTSIPVINSEYDEFHPSIARAPGGEFYALAEYTQDDLVWHPLLLGSADGYTWEPIVEFFYDSEYTDMDQNDHGTYGTFGTNDSTIVLIQGEIEDGWIWDFEGAFTDFSNNRIACYTFEGPNGDPGKWNWGAITCVGYNGYYGNDIQGCPFIIYPSSELVVEWLPVEGCEHVGSTIDLETNMHYAVYDIDTGSGNYDLLVRKDNFGVWIDNGEYWKHPLVMKFEITATENLTNPSITAYDNNVIIACQKDDDIIVYYSTNGLSSKTEVLVETDASYPEVAKSGCGTILITYIKDGALYYRISDDCGAIWTDAYVVSDNQINPNYRATNLDKYLLNIYGIWEDTRGDNIDIYYDLIYEEAYEPPLAPTITGPNGGKKGQPYTFNFNSLDTCNYDVRYHIDWGDGTYNITGFMPSGINVPIIHTWFSNDIYTIIAFAENEWGAFGAESMKTFKVTREKSASSSPNLRFLDNFPLLTLILQRLIDL